MGRLDGIRQQASQVIGETAYKVAIVWPPMSVSSRNSFGGRLRRNGPADWLGPDESLTGMAAKFGDGGNGVLAVTRNELVYLEMKAWGRPVRRRASWPIGEVDFRFLPKRTFGYFGVHLRFSDGSEVTLRGEKRWGIQVFEHN